MSAETLHKQNESSINKDTVLLLGGVALCIFGAGLVLSNPTVRRYLEQLRLTNLVQGSMPDIERYFKIRAM